MNSQVNSVSQTPSEGIFYVVRYPKGWKLLAYRFKELTELDHSQFWEKYAAVNLSRLWDSHRRNEGDNRQGIFDELRYCPYGFPRGRIVKTETRFSIFHGGDFMAVSKVKRTDIENYFGIQGKSRWLRDEHERCLLHDKEIIRDTLQIRENWNAVEYT